MLQENKILDKHKNDKRKRNDREKLRNVQRMNVHKGSS